MAQFDVFRLADGTVVVDCQSDLLDHYDTRFAVPLIEAERDSETMPRLHPRFMIDGQEMILVTQFATAIRAKDLRTRIARLEHERLKIITAIDVLTGSG